MQAFPYRRGALGALLCVVLTACGPGKAISQADLNGLSAASADPASDTPAVGAWYAATAGQILDVPLSDLHPTQGALGFDQIYYKLGRYEIDKEKEFDDFCADEGLTGVTTYSTSSVLTDASSYACTTTDTTQRDTTVLSPVVVGPNGSTLYLTDGHHGLSTYYEVPDGGPTLHVHVTVKDNLSAYSGDAFWAEMKSRGYTWLEDANGATITPDQLPTALGFSHGMGNDHYRSLVYFTRDVGYSKPTAAPDYLEFYWANWLRSTSFLSSYDLTRMGAMTTDPGVAATSEDTGYVNATWNASVAMVASSDPVISGETGAQLGRLTTINAGKKYSKGTFGDLLNTMTATKPGKIAYMLNYKTAHNLQ